jgi:hypothetical protein
MKGDNFTKEMWIHETLCITPRHLVSLTMVLEPKHVAVKLYNVQRIVVIDSYSRYFYISLSKRDVPLKNISFLFFSFLFFSFICYTFIT